MLGKIARTLDVTSRHLVCIAFVTLLACSDENKPPERGATGVAQAQSPAPSKIQAAREALKKMKAAGMQMPPLLMLVLDQPDFSGVLRESGALVVVDRNKGVIGGVTLKVLDYETRTRHVPRVLSGDELAPVAQQVIGFLTKMTPDWKGQSITVQIFSQSFQLALADAALNESSAIQHLLGRGGGDEKEIVFVDTLDSRSGKGQRVAAEIMYLESAALSGDPSGEIRFAALKKTVDLRWPVKK